MADSLRQQAQRLYRVFGDLVRAYQFRDRGEICCHGVSVSQCYTLEVLATDGPMTMGELADHLFLEISSMTRVVDGLVADKLAARVSDARDRRICRVKISTKGRSLVSQIRNDLIREHELILRDIPAQSREAVISAMSQLLAAFNERQRCLAEELQVGRRG